MTTGQKRDWEGPSRRRVPRFDLQAPVDVTVVRSGMPSTVPGRSANFGERGIAAVIAGELVSGETVDVEIKLSPTTEPLQLHAIVRYQEQQRCGLEFVAMTAAQKSVVREWARDPRSEAAITSPVSAKITHDQASQSPSNSQPGRGRRKARSFGLTVLVLLLIGAALFWWRWERGWRQLESRLSTSGSSAADKPTRVPAEAIQKLLVHRVEPAYPPEARERNLQGIIALDIVVGRDGSVRSVRPLNGPDVLAKAAVDALRWWKFDPYRVKGEPVIVESTVAVEFKR